MTSCASSHKKEATETSSLPEVYLPAVPYPEDADLIALDGNLEEITDEETEVEYIALKKSYFKKIMNYFADTEKAAEILQAFNQG